ncbi:MAG: hypothetical protein GX956_02240 [Firmicutes bacterium]|nr:hypothetical protein [Bacillota bacterium]
MKNFWKSSILHIGLIASCAVLRLATPIYAEELPKSLNLNLNLPPLQVEEGQETDVIEEKYREILGEISISSEAVEVVDKIKDQVLEVKTITLDFVATQVKGKRTEQVAGKLSAGVEHKLARAEFSVPSELRGYIIVVDQEKMETKTFQPVTNQIMVQALEDMSKEALSALSVADVTSYFDFTIYDVELLESIERDGGVWEYLLQVEGWKEQDLVKVKVRSDTWIPHEILLYEDQVFMGKLEFSNVVLNVDLSSEQLKDLPKVKEVRM